MRRAITRQPAWVFGVAIWFATVALAQTPSAPSLPATSPVAAPVVGAVTIPAGTHVLMRLESPLHTTSATEGSGVYLATAMPVVQGNRVVIPENTRVLGTVVGERRPGRVRGRAQLRLKFTTMVLPDNRVLTISGGLQSLPGSSRNRKVDDGGTLEPVDQMDKDVINVVAGAGGLGLIGAAGGGPMGALKGAAIGAGLGLAKSMYTRGDAIWIPAGARVEMVLQRPIVVEEQ